MQLLPQRELVLHCTQLPLTHALPTPHSADDPQRHTPPAQPSERNVLHTRPQAPQLEVSFCKSAQ